MWQVRDAAVKNRIINRRSDAFKNLQYHYAAPKVIPSSLGASLHEKWCDRNEQHHSCVAEEWCWKSELHHSYRSDVFCVVLHHSWWCRVMPLHRMPSRTRRDAINQKLYHSIRCKKWCNHLHTASLFASDVIARSPVTPRQPSSDAFLTIPRHFEVESPLALLCI